MASLLVVLNWLLPLFYLAVLIDYGATFFLRTKVSARNRWLAPLLGVHTGFLVLRAIRLGQPPLINVYEILSVLALSTAIVYAVVEFAGRDRRTGVFVFLLVFLFQYTSSSFLAQGIAVGQVAGGEGQSGWARLHIVPALVAYTAFAIAAVYGLLHILAQRNLKLHHFGLLFDRLPSLDLLGRMTWYALLSGFVFITLTMVTGPILFSHPGAVGQGDVAGAKVTAKIVIGSVAWVIYVVAVLGKLLRKWPAAWISKVAVTGFVVIMILFIVSGVLSR